MYDTSNRTDRANAMQDMKPDLSLYDGENGLSKYVIDEDERKSSTVREEGRRPYLGRTAWAWMTSFIEVKSSAKWAPFNFDDSGKFEVKDTDLGRRARAQVTKYATEIRLRQPRTFVLCAFVWQDWVRFMRWDQAGAIVSAADNYVKDPRRLLDFVHGISTPSREGWGYDPTVTLVNHNDAAVKSRIDKIRESLPTNSYLANVFAESFGGDMDDHPLYEVCGLAFDPFARKSPNVLPCRSSVRMCLIAQRTMKLPTGKRPIHRGHIRTGSRRYVLVPARPRAGA